jgi:hypothetical protein
MWCHHFEPTGKTAGMQWRHPSSPQLTKFKSQASTSKAMLTVSFDIQGHLLLNFKQRSDKAHANRYCKTLQKLHTKIKNKCTGKQTELPCCKIMPVPMWLTEFRTNQMPRNGRYSNILHTSQTYSHTIFRSLDHQRKPSKAIHSNRKKMCRRLWYSALGSSPKNSWQTGHTNLCINETSV